MIAVQILFELEKWLPLLITVIIFVFNLGVYFRRIITLPDKEEVQKMIERNNQLLITPEAFRQKFSEHLKDCTNKSEIEKIKQELKSHKEQTVEDIEIMKRGILEVRINLKNICDHLGVKYHNGNS